MRQRRAACGVLRVQYRRRTAAVVSPPAQEWELSTVRRRATEEEESVGYAYVAGPSQSLLCGQ